MKLVDTTTVAHLPDYDLHEAILTFERPEVGLFGYIAIHNTALGPATGGTRMFPYQDKYAALSDVLRLSRAMTYKCAIANLPFGGGKAVILLDPLCKTPALLRAYAEEINCLDGFFTTGEDVGLSVEDVETMLSVSSHFNGNPLRAGDPSPFAALSTYVAMGAAANVLFGAPDLQGLSVAVKGLGKVGRILVELLLDTGARVYIADIKPQTVEAVSAVHRDVKVVDADLIHTVSADIYAPCALGSDLTYRTAAELKARLICGAANNQLATEDVGDCLFDRGIFYVPDYVANAGGLINVMDEREPEGYCLARVTNRIEAMAHTTITLLSRALLEGKPPHRIANQIAESKFKRPSGSAQKKLPPGINVAAALPGHSGRTKAGKAAGDADTLRTKEW